jgi:serine/threonine protein kinase
MITVNHLNSKKCKTSAGDRVEGALEDFIYSKCKSRTLPKKNNLKPLPDAEAFVLSDRKRTKPLPDIRGFVPVPNTPMKRSQTDEERTQQERYDAEMSHRFSSMIPLGSTKNSTVYRVTDTLSTPYALKELNPALLTKKKKQQKAVLNEYKNAKLLQGHPNIVRYDTFWRCGPHICFQMEYLPGGSLDRYVQEHPLYDSVNNCEKEIVWNFLTDLLMGLDFMHKRNIVHLDIKPSNILLNLRPGSSIPVLKIGDFGLSRKLDRKSTYEGYKRGDGKYLAPELLDSKSEITTAVDIFSLGVTIYEIASDYTANDALWEEIINERISYDKVSKDLKGVLGLMLCRTPEIRVTAGNCLLINDRLQELADLVDFIEPPLLSMSEEEME